MGPKTFKYYNPNCKECETPTPRDSFQNDFDKHSDDFRVCNRCLAKRPPPPEGEKVCRKCAIRKHVTEFHKDKKGKMGRKSVCKECRNMTDEQKEINWVKRLDKRGIDLDFAENELVPMEQVEMMQKHPHDDVPCYCCEEFKTFNHFHLNRSPSAESRNYCGTYCKECWKEARRLGLRHPNSFV